jgi:hypothetical protein
MARVRMEKVAPRSMWRHGLNGLQLGAEAAAIALLAMSPAAWAQVPATLNGAPIQVTPYAMEPGVPNVTIPLGTPTQSSSGTGAGTGTGTGSGSSSDTGAATGGSALNTLLSQSWGSTAVSEAEAIGINPSAVAATCVMESGCQNLSGSGAQGAFQMFPAAYQEGLQTALAANPSLESQIVQGSAGMNDPATEAVAAAGYLMQANTALQDAGVSQPTVLDARGYYNFGPSAGPQIAQAADSDLMSQYVKSSALAANNIPSTETVGQWKAAVAAKIGNAANQPILS